MNEFNPNRLPVAIIDLDGTICDDRRRRPLLPTSYLKGEVPPPSDSDFDAYHADCLNDPLIHRGIVDYHRRQGDFIAFVTARPEKFIYDTARWIDRHFPDLPNFTIVMRPTADRTHSAELKVRLIGQRFRWEDIVAVYDDRADVLTALEEYVGEKTTLRRVILPSEPELPIVEATPEPTPVEATRAPTPVDCLQAGIALFNQRNPTYREAYIGFGDVMTALFPEGLSVSGPARFAELGVVIQILSKITRMTGDKNLELHLDSVRDLKVYAAMLESLLERR